MPTDNPLGEFEGHPILSSAVELPSLAGGLREAAEVQGGRIIPKDEEAFLLVKVKGNKTRFDPVKNTDGYQRVDIPAVEGLTFVEGAAFEKAIADHAAAVEAHRLERQREREEREGTQRIPGTEPWPTGEDDGLPDGPGPEGELTDEEWEGSARQDDGDGEPDDDDGGTPA